MTSPIHPGYGEDAEIAMAEDEMARCSDYDSTDPRFDYGESWLPWEEVQKEIECDVCWVCGEKLPQGCGPTCEGCSVEDLPPVLQARCQQLDDDQHPCAGCEQLEHGGCPGNSCGGQLD